MGTQRKRRAEPLTWVKRGRWGFVWKGGMKGIPGGLTCIRGLRLHVSGVYRTDLPGEQVLVGSNT